MMVDFLVTNPFLSRETENVVDPDVFVLPALARNFPPKFGWSQYSWRLGILSLSLLAQNLGSPGEDSAEKEGPR